MKSDDKDTTRTRGDKGRALRRAKDVAGQVAEIGWKATQARVVAGHAVEDGVRLARRTVTRSRYAAEDIADAATLEIRRHPLRAMGVAFAAGALFGCLVGLLAGRALGPRA